MKPQNIFSLTVYKRTIWLQIILDVLAMIGLITSSFLMMRFKTLFYQNLGIYLWQGVGIYTLFRIIYLAVIFVQIIYFKQFKKLFLFSLFILLVFIQFYGFFMVMAAVWAGGAGH
jgi:hypothetical protein